MQPKVTNLQPHSSVPSGHLKLSYSFSFHLSHSGVCVCMSVHVHACVHGMSVYVCALYRVLRSLKGL